MKVERSKFLLIAGSMAGATGLIVACSSTSTSTPNTLPDASTVDSGDLSDATTSTDGSTDADAGTTCLGDTVADAGIDTDAGDAASGCEALTGASCAAACSVVETKFKAGVADDVRKCLAPAPTCEGTQTVSDCIVAAAPKVCADPTATTECTPLVTACAGVDAGASTPFNQANCEAVMKMLNAAGRDELKTCVTEGVEGNCTAEPGFCVDSLTQGF